MDGRVALVPWADMLNHNCEVVNNTSLKMSVLYIFDTTVSDFFRYFNCSRWKHFLTMINHRKESSLQQTGHICQVSRYTLF